jgi:hypothetical protein
MNLEAGKAVRPGASGQEAEFHSTPRRLEAIRPQITLYGIRVIGTAARG